MKKAIVNLHNQIMELLYRETHRQGQETSHRYHHRPARLHYPTDAWLLADAVRVITRAIEKIEEIVKLKTVFRSQMRKVKDKMQEKRKRELGKSLGVRTCTADAHTKTFSTGTSIGHHTKLTAYLCVSSSVSLWSQSARSW